MENTNAELNVVTNILKNALVLSVNINFRTASPMPSNSQNEHNHLNPHPLVFSYTNIVFI